MLAISHEAPPVPRALEICPGALESLETPSYQTMGAFRIQVGLDLCGLEQLLKLLQRCWVACKQEGGRGGGREGPPMQIGGRGLGT